MASAKRPAPPTSAGPSDSPPQEMVRIGRIAGMHGVRGALKCRPDNPDSDSFESLDRITIEIDGERREYELRSVAPAGRGTLKIELSGVSDANAAEALKGGIVMVPDSSLPPPGPGEFYYFQAIGCEVFLTDGTAIGTIAEVFSNGANDVMVVRKDRQEVLVPVIEDVVKSIDLEARRVVIEAVPGLLDS